MRRRSRWLLGLAIVAAIAGCDSSPSLPLLTDPHEIVTATATSTAALGSLRVQVDLTGHDQGGRGGQDRVRIQLEADIDMQRRNLAGRAQLTMEDGVANAGAGEFVVVDGSTFTRESPTSRWWVNDDGGAGAHLPTNAEYVALLETAIAKGSAVLTLGEASPCGDGTCYHVTAALDREAAWQLIAAPLVGQRAGVGAAAPDEIVPSAATLEIYVDQKTRSLVGLTGSLSIATTEIAFSITFSNHDLPIRIAPPPPELVDSNNMEGGGVQQVPAESP